MNNAKRVEIRALLLGLVLFGFESAQGAAFNCIGGKKRGRTEGVSIPTDVRWRRKSHLSDEEFLERVRQDSVPLAANVSESLATNFPELTVPLTWQYRMVAQNLGMSAAAMGGYVVFPARGSSERLAGPDKKTQEYKIHLMPRDEDLLAFSNELAKIIQQSSYLLDRIVRYKFIVQPEGAGDFPRVVLYFDRKKKAQEALEILFHRLAHIQGTGMRPRYSAYLNDLIWVAQGNGDEKAKEENHQYYEQPDMVYFKNNYSGTVQDYHLKHPVTGQDLVSPVPTNR